MKTAQDYLAAAHANSMPPAWCAARLAEARAWRDATPQTWPGWQHVHELLSQLDSAAAKAEQAVQAVIDHYEPPLPTVFPPACPRCTQRRDQCICPPMFPREESPF